MALTTRDIAAHTLADALEQSLNIDVFSRPEKRADLPEGTVMIEVSETLMREIINILRGQA